MAKRNINQALARSFQTEDRSSDIGDLDTGKPQLVSINQLKNSPLNTDNEKTPEVIESLMTSISVLGLLEPLTVYKDDDNFFTIISGAGRLEAIKGIRQKDPKAFEKVLCIVRRKPRNADEEKIWIDSANVQRNTPSIERTRKNIRTICLHAKNMADQGYGEFDDLIKGMTLLKRSSVYNYMRISENLSKKLLKLFDEEELSVSQALLYSHYSKAEQDYLYDHYYKGGKFNLSKGKIKEYLNEKDKADQEEEIKRLQEELEEKDRDIKRLQDEMEKKTPKRSTRKGKDPSTELKKKEKELQLLKDQLKMAQDMIPVPSEEEKRRMADERALTESLGFIESQMTMLTKNVRKYDRKYGRLNNTMQEYIRSIQKMSDELGK